MEWPERLQGVRLQREVGPGHGVGPRKERACSDLGGRLSFQLGLFKSQMPWHHEMCPWESSSGGPESGGLHQSAPAERMRAFQSDGSRRGNGVSEQPRVWVTQVPNPPGDEGRV